MNDTKRIICACLAATAAPAVVPACAFMLTPDIDGSSIPLLIAVTVAVMIGAGVHVVLLGLPLFALVRKLGMIRWWTALLGGFLAGSPLSILFLWAGLSSPKPAAGVFYAASFYSGVGAFAGLAAWTVWRLTGLKTTPTS